MIAKSYRELVCWQLSVQLRDELIAITARPAFAIERDGEPSRWSARPGVPDDVGASTLPAPRQNAHSSPRFACLSTSGAV